MNIYIKIIVVGDIDPIPDLYTRDLNILLTQNSLLPKTLNQCIELEITNQLDYDLYWSKANDDPNQNLFIVQKKSNSKGSCANCGSTRDLKSTNFKIYYSLKPF